MENRAMVEYLPGLGYQMWFSSSSPPPVSTPTHTLYSVELCMVFPLLDWFSIQLGLVFELIILDLATRKSLLLS